MATESLVALVVVILVFAGIALYAGRQNKAHRKSRNHK